MIKINKILFFSRSFYPNIGGVEKHVLEVSKILINNNYKVIVITENNNYPDFEKLKINNGEIEIFRINTGKDDWFKKFRIWIRLIKYIKIISSSDIVHCHDIFYWYLPFRFLYPFKKVYTTFHGYEGNNIPGKKAVIWHKIAELLSVNNICIGNFYKKWYGTNAGIISYGAISNDYLNKPNSSPKKLKDIIFIGRLEKETGILKYLEALYILKKKKYKLHLDVFGDGNLKIKAIDFCKQNKLDVSFKGFINDADLYINNYKYVFTSRYLGILEALVFKKPIFAEYNNLIKKDYLFNTPFAKYISINGTSKGIAQSLINIMLNKDNINIEDGYIWVKNQTWEKMTQNYLKLWGNK